MNKKFFNIKETETSATIEIYGDIGQSWWDETDNTITSITAQLNAIPAEKDITVKINSLGGDVNHAFAIFEALKERNVTVELTGMNASAATVIAMAGKKRRMSRYGLFLIHKCSSLVWGNENTLEQELEDQRIINEKILDVYADVTGTDRATIEALMNENEGKGKWIDSKQALEYGFITEEIEPATPSNKYNSAALDKYGLPRLPKDFANESESGAVERFAQKVINLIKNPKNMKIADENKNLAAVASEMTESNQGEFEKAFEAKNSEIDSLKKDIETKDKAISDKDAEIEQQKQTISDKDAEIARLNAIVADIPQNKQEANGDDTKGEEESFSDWVKKQPYYNEVKEITGK